DPEGLKKRTTQITVQAPYKDSVSGSFVTTVFHPLWTNDRKGFAGCVGLDLTLDQLIASIKDVKLAQTGLAFLAQSDGNVLAVNDAGAEVLALKAASKDSGASILQRTLKDSAEPRVAQIRLPQTDNVDYHEITIRDQPHILVLQRLDAVNSLADNK